MRDDHPAGRNLGRHLRQAAGDEFVGQAVEAVAAHAFVVEMLRDRVVVRQRIVAAVEGGVEAGDLRQVGGARENGADRREIVRLVQRRQRHIAFELGQHLVVDQDRPVVVRAAMHDAMPDRDRLELLRRRAARRPPSRARPERRARCSAA